jgi:hypothetical protein
MGMDHYETVDGRSILQFDAAVYKKSSLSISIIAYIFQSLLLSRFISLSYCLYLEYIINRGSTKNIMLSYDK